MGSMLEAECPCGYVKSEICFGIGMLGIGLGPGICHKCREIVSVETHQIGMPPNVSSEQKRLRCSKCGRKPQMLELIMQPIPETEDEESSFSHQDSLDSEAVYLCPKCDQKTLKLYEVGFWD